MIDEKDMPYAAELLKMAEWGADEHREQFVWQIVRLVQYWQSLDKSKDEAIGGIAHSILTLLDNLNCGSNVDYLLLGNGVVVNDGNGMDLHELFSVLQELRAEEVAK